MEKFIEKLSRYNLLNNFIPGILFLCLLNMLDIYDIDMTDWVVVGSLGYFAGMVLSRIGSIAIEPLLQKWEIVKYAPYSEYLEATKKDVKIHELLIENNMYRTIVAMLIVLLALYICHIIPAFDKFLHTQCAMLVLIVLLLLIYVMAFRKQTSYIRKRVKKANNLPVE